METVKTEKARYGHGTGRIIVDECPYCHKTHYHNLPVGEGQRMADCFQGEYVLDFSVAPDWVYKCRGCKTEYPEDKSDLLKSINPSGIEGVVCLCGGILDLCVSKKEGAIK